MTKPEKYVFRFRHGVFFPLLSYSKYITGGNFYYEKIQKSTFYIHFLSAYNGIPIIF